MILAFTENDVLRKNVKDLEEQLHNALIRIKELNQRIMDIQTGNLKPTK